MPINNPEHTTVLEEGVVVKTRPRINFIGATVTATDDAVNGKIDVTVEAGAGGGDVVGPDASVDNAIARFDGETGKAIQDYTSGAPTISDTGELTMAADISLGANKLKTTNTIIKEIDATSAGIRNAADNAYLYWRTSRLYTDQVVISNGGDIMAPNGDDQSIEFLARDNGVAQVEVARLQGAADPYFSAGGSQEFKFYNSGVANIGGNVSVDALVTVDGRDISVDGDKLDGIATGADVTADNAPQAHKDSHDPNDGSDPLDTANAAEISAVVAAGTGTSHSLARADHVHAINHGITDNHLLSVDDAAAADDDFARFTANGIEGITVAEAQTALLAAALPENTGIILDAALSADGKYCATMLKTGTAGTNLAFGEAVYFAVADSKWEKAKGDAEATVAPMTGIVVVAGNEDAAVTVMIIGEARADAQFPALTVGAPVFISAATAGAVTSTELTTGQYQKAIGWATSANSILVTGNPNWVKVQ